MKQISSVRVNADVWRRAKIYAANSKDKYVSFLVERLLREELARAVLQKGEGGA